MLLLLLEQDPTRLGDRHLGLGLVVEARDGFAFGVIAHDSGEDHDPACTRV